MPPHSLPCGCPYAALGSNDALRECEGEGNAPWFMFGEACGLGVCWFMPGWRRWGGVGEWACVVAIWFIRSEGFTD